MAGALGKLALAALSVTMLCAWKPLPQDSYDLQYDDSKEIHEDIDIIALDLFDTDPATIREIHQKGAKTVCYINAGAWEEWRPDRGVFPPNTMGREYEGWPGEKWLDIRQKDELKPLMAARIKLCADKGFDGIEWDNLDNYDNKTGFDISRDEQIAYNKMLSDLAKAQNLSVGFKNAPDLVPDLAAYFDWVVVEGCDKYDECKAYKTFADQSKLVVVIIYHKQGFGSFCQKIREMGFTGILKNESLDAYLKECNPKR